MRVITLRFSDRVDGFNDEPVQEFVRDKDVVEVRDHFFERDGTPYLALLVIYRARTEPGPAEPKGKVAGRAKEDWRKELSDEQWPLFNALREWRSERAKADGVPPYVIATNRQFVEIVKKRPDTFSLLGSVDGFGQAKLKRYGADIIRIIGAASVAGQAPEPPATPPTPEHGEPTDPTRDDASPTEPAAGDEAPPDGDNLQTP